MKIEVTTAIAMEWFRNWNRDYYTWEGMDAILEYYDEVDPDMPFNVVDICCECTEYGAGAACSWEDFIRDYEDYYPREEYREDNYLDENDELYDDEYIEQLAEKLESYKTVLHADNGNYVVFEF